MKTIRLLIATLAVTSSLACSARAADAGALNLPMDHFNKAHAELVYDYTQRGLEDGPWSTFKADTVFLRIHTAVGQKATLDFDVGMINAEDADAAFYGGAGLRLLIHDASTWRIGAHLQGHYAADLAEDGDGALEYDLWEIDGGILWNGRFRLADDLLFIPYAGPALSTLNLDGEADGEDFDADADQIFGAIAGLAFELPEGHTFRLEARWFDEVSFSAAAGIVF